ncbi:hypothetical protein CVIRNUC_003001 [Coccomyxa viridis]|uniref:Uncharacterized protein n=1 Tax=Coccomyxa viridis TaxID=1274662 RepID=A0AAV1HYU8_9CHLO|nr:hypothetical protein CVIRNUC_003001 [Coccomyxa viridis]
MSLQKDVDTTLRVLESGFAHLANQPTVGLYYLREHICSAAPTVLEDYKGTAALNRELERGRADAQSASECMAGLRAACTDKLTILEDRLAAAMEATTKVQALEHRHHWASGVAHSLLSAPMLPKYPNPFRK